MLELDGVGLHLGLALVVRGGHAGLDGELVIASQRLLDGGEAEVAALGVGGPGKAEHVDVGVHDEVGQRGGHQPLAAEHRVHWGGRARG